MRANNQDRPQAQGQQQRQAEESVHCVRLENLSPIHHIDQGGSYRPGHTLSSTAAGSHRSPPTAGTTLSPMRREE